ncbi:hypothetical protein CRV15_11705 [Streptomyces clavuligerus]|nr:hypothetical protein CRV15_11705 [Streptomyces clavuligerus]
MKPDHRGRRKSPFGAPLGIRRRRHETTTDSAGGGGARPGRFAGPLRHGIGGGKARRGGPGPRGGRAVRGSGAAGPGRCALDGEVRPAPALRRDQHGLRHLRDSAAVPVPGEPPLLHQGPIRRELDVPACSRTTAGGLGTRPSAARRRRPLALLTPRTALGTPDFSTR